MKFTKDFKLGAAIAAEEVEGRGTTLKAKTEGDLFYAEEPEFFFHGIGNQFTNDMMRHYETDFELFKKVGCDSMRSSFSGARLFPNDNFVPNPEAVKYYHAFLAAAKNNGIDMFMTLTHFDLPAYVFKDKENDGWCNLATVDKFAKYAEFVFKEFKEVKHFATFNEPVVALSGYNGSKARGPRINNLQKAYLVAYHEILAHARAVNLFNAKYKTNENEIGIVINGHHAYPQDNKTFSAADAQAAHAFNLLNNYVFLDPALLGTYDHELLELLKKHHLNFAAQPAEIAEIKKAQIQGLGVNFYQPERVSAPTIATQEPISLDCFYKKYHWDAGRYNVFRGGEIYPQALIDMAEIIKTKYHNIKWLITENGMGVENEALFKDPQTQQIQDDYRIAFVSEHLQALHTAISQGANCVGYQMGAAIDNWSGVNAYKNRYGFIEINLNNMERTIKKSGIGFSQLSKTHELADNFLTVEKTIDLTKVKFTKSR